MAAVRFQFAESPDGVRGQRTGLGRRDIGWVLLAWGIALAGLGALSTCPARAAVLIDAPVIWYEDDRDGIVPPSKRDPNPTWAEFHDAVILPVSRCLDPDRLARTIGTTLGGQAARPAANVNALDEVVNSTWFTNRIGLYTLEPEAVARGSGDGSGPDRSAPWTLLEAETVGDRPRLMIRDAAGTTYQIRFDPIGYPGTTSAADAISSRILHAAGYNVPEDAVVNFRRSEIDLGADAGITLPDGGKRAMTASDLDVLLAGVDRTAEGEWRALASKVVEGQTLGPFRYEGRRRGDPNDRVNHEDRRELRGLAVFAAWLCHYDMGQQHCLDTVVEEGGKRFIRHHLVDFTSTLGAGESGPVPRYGFEYTLNLAAILGRTLAVGTHEDRWRSLRRPEGLDEVGYFESDLFDPLRFQPLQPNPAFLNLTDGDGYWAAKIISAFTDEQLTAIVRAGNYQNPRAAAYVARTLAERRDKIARAWFERIPPLDFFMMDGKTLRFRDLGAERDLYPGTQARYRMRVAGVTPEGDPARWFGWVESPRPEIPIDTRSVRVILREAPVRDYPFLCVECQVNRGEGWSPSVNVYFSRTKDRLVAVDRAPRVEEGR